MGIVPVASSPCRERANGFHPLCSKSAGRTAVIESSSLIWLLCTYGLAEGRS